MNVSCWVGWRSEWQKLTPKQFVLSTREWIFTKPGSKSKSEIPFKVLCWKIQMLLSQLVLSVNESNCKYQAFKNDLCPNFIIFLTRQSKIILMLLEGNQENWEENEEREDDLTCCSSHDTKSLRKSDGIPDRLYLSPSYGQYVQPSPDQTHNDDGEGEKLVADDVCDDVVSSAVAVANGG